MQDPSPPESLLNFEPPLFVGGNSKDSTKPVPESSGAASQVDEIINSMLPPRCVLARPLSPAAAATAGAPGATATTDSCCTGRCRFAGALRLYLCHWCWCWCCSDALVLRSSGVRCLWHDGV